ASGLDLEPLDDEEPAALHQSLQAPPLRIALRPIDDAPRPKTMFDQDEAALEPLAPPTKIDELEAGVTGMMETLRPVMEPIDEQVSAWTRWQRRRAAGRAGRPPLLARLGNAGRPAIAALEAVVRFALALGPRLQSVL